MGVGSAAWILTFGVIAVELLWFVLRHRHVISGRAAIGLVLVTAGVAIWLAPYFIRARLKTGGAHHEQ